MKGELYMKIVVVDKPKFWSFFLRRVFGIKKEKDVQYKSSDGASFC